LITYTCVICDKVVRRRGNLKTDEATNGYPQWKLLLKTSFAKKPLAESHQKCV
jgi:hypothetical protein